MKAKALALWLAVVFAPLIVMSVYLVFSRWPARWFTGTFDYAGLTVSVFVGAASLFLVLESRVKKVVGLVLYVPLAGLVVGWYTLGFVCAAFGDCL